MLIKRIPENEIRESVAQYNNELVDGEEPITFEEYCEIEGIIREGEPFTAELLSHHDSPPNLIQSRIDERDLSKVNKIGLIKAIRTAGRESNLHHLQGAKALAEQIAEQINKEFGRLERATVIDNTVEPSDYYHLIIDMFDNVRNDGERICHHEVTDCLLLLDFDKETGRVRQETRISAYQGLELISERMEKRRLSTRRVEDLLKSVDWESLAKVDWKSLREETGDDTEPELMSGGLIEVHES